MARPEDVCCMDIATFGHIAYQIHQNRNQLKFTKCCECMIFLKEKLFSGMNFTV